MTTIVSWQNSANILRQHIRDTWLRAVNTVNTDNPRITDYAKPLVFLLENYDASIFSATENARIQQHLRNICTFLQAESFQTRRFADSNWQAYRLWVLASIAVVLRRSDVMEQVHRGFRQYVQDTTIRSSGAVLDFVTRDSVTYHVYTLFAMVKVVQTLEVPRFQPAAPLSKWWSGDDTLRTLLVPHIRFLLPYLDRTKTHREFVNSTILSDRQRTDSGRLFDPSHADYLLREIAHWGVV